MALIQIHDLHKVYNGSSASVHALRGVSVEIEEREFLALMGPSGCGKSTLLGILGGMTPPTRGSIVIDGIDVYELSVERRADLRREYIGFVFQQLYLVGYLSVLENVMLPLAAGGVPNGRQQAMAAEALERVGLADKLARLPRELSGGEQQRVAIARAIVNSPPLLVADEPTGCLDSKTGRGIMELFSDLRESGLTIFMVTHDSAVAGWADRKLKMQDGVITGTEAGSRYRVAETGGAELQGQIAQAPVSNSA
jgi:putative ABC transport system ATP-binding protein